MTDIVNLTGQPLLIDVPAQLRKMADEWEAGYFGKANYAMVIVPADSQWDWPKVMGLGFDPGDLQRCGLVAQTQAWLTINKVARAR